MYAKAINDAMGERSIKVVIAGRTYPLTVSEREADFVEEAVRRINERVKELEASYSVKDKQDLLAMAALQFATQYLDAKTKVVEDQDALLDDLKGIDELIANRLINV